MILFALIMMVVFCFSAEEAVNKEGERVLLGVAGLFLAWAILAIVYEVVSR